MKPFACRATVEVFQSLQRGNSKSFIGHLQIMPLPIAQIYEKILTLRATSWLFFQVHINCQYAGDDQGDAMGDEHKN